MSSVLNPTDNVDAKSDSRHVPDIKREMGAPFMSLLRTQAFKAEFDASCLKMPKYLRCLMPALSDAPCKTLAFVAGKF